MATTLRKTTLGALGLVTVATLAANGVADWPSARHDGERSASASGTSNLVQPATYWRHFHGGTIASAGALAADVDGDGSPEVVMATGGGVAAKRPATGDVVWENGGIGFASLDGLVDLDGDGTKELLLHTGQQAFVLRVSDGETLWAEPAGEMGTLAALRVGDLSGDGIADVVIHECGCCSVNSGKSAVVYRFAGEGASLAAPQPMWSPPVQFCGGSRSAAIARMRSPTQADFVFGTGDRLQLRDGASGAVVATMPNFGVAVQASQCSPIDVDGDGREELFCVLVDTSGTPNNGRRAYLVKYVLNPDPQLKVVWQSLVGTQDGNVRLPAGFLADLDGDGRLEATLGGKNAASEWSTYVFDVLTGAERARIDGQLAVGVARIHSKTTSAVITDKAGTLSAYEFGADPGDGLIPLWSLEKHGAMTAIDLAAGNRSSVASRLVTIDLDRDGIDELLTTVGTGTSVELVRATGGVPSVIGSYFLPANVSTLAAWSFPFGDARVLALAQSDGNLHLLDDALAPVSGNPGFGARFGGFFSSSQFRLLATSPVVGDLGDGVPGVLLVTSRGALQRIDAREASLASPPTVIWTRERTVGAQIVPALAASAGGSPGVLAVEKHPGASDRVVALSPDGGLLWEREVLGAVLADLVHGNLDGDGVPDVVVEHGDLGDSLDRVTALSGATGAVLWQAAPLGPGNRQPAGGAMTDWNGDGFDDFVYVFQKTRILDGKTGLLLAESPLGGDYFMPILFDVDGDGDKEISLYAGYTAPRTIAHDLASLLWQGQPDDRPMTYGAMVACPQGGMLLGGSWSVRPRLSRVVAGGPSGAGLTATQILAGGASYPDLAAAQAANAKTGQLGSPAIHRNLAGDGVPVALVGSEDGWLYGVEPCSGDLRFSHRIGGPVGAIAIGDANGDGIDEVLASSADGYLYGVQHLALPGVTEVRDTDPPGGKVDGDVDSIATSGTLFAAWPDVAGAEGYEAAVLRDALDGGGFVPGGAWRLVGAATTATLDGLTLEDGRRYFVAVRAIAGSRRSPDAISDGVTVSLVEEPGTGGAGGTGGSPGSGSTADPEALLFGRGCGCATSPSPMSRPAIGAALVMALAAARLRRQRTGCPRARDRAR